MSKMRKRLFMLTFIMIVFGLVQILSQKVEAAGNGSITSAQAYTLGTTKSGSITENGPDKQYYKFTLPSSGSIQISGSAYMAWVYLYIYDAAANEVWRVNPSWNSTSEVITINENVFLTSGTYYFCVGRDGHSGSYNFKIDFTSSSESFKEGQGGSNNTLSTASNINVGNTLYTAQLAENDEKDFFKFNLGQSGKINLNATFYKMTWIYWRLYDEKGVELFYRNPSWNGTTENIVVNEDIYLTSGSYYLGINVDNNSYGKYTFSIPFTSSNETYAETNGGSNNTISTASTLTLGNNYNGQLAVNDDKDFYKFSLSAKAPLSLNITGDVGDGYIKMYDSSGNEISSKSFYKDNTTQKVSCSEVLSLEAGTYYISISKGTEGGYTLNLSRLTQDNCPHDYESEWHSATYFEQGYRLHTCKWCGKTYQDEYSNKLILSKPTISTSYSYGMKKKLKMQWSSVYDATGYELSYATKKNFKNAKKINIKGKHKTSRTIKKLKKKKWYYVRVRAYVQSDGKKAYSPWSGKVKIRTR